MHIKTVRTGYLSENCYIVISDDTARCVLVDPGDEAGKIVAAVEAAHAVPELILLTHGHFDHIGALGGLREKYDAKIAVHRDDAGMLENPRADKYLSDGETVSAAGMEFSILHTPGHTRGSCCITCGGYMFSGDTLFAGDIGRTDLPGGDEAAMRRSLARLSALPGDYTVLPGHGSATTLEQERRRGTMQN